MKKQVVQPVGIIAQRGQAAAEAVRQSEAAHGAWGAIGERIRTLKNEKARLESARCTLPLAERSARLEEINAELPKRESQIALARNDAHTAEITRQEARVALAHTQRSAFLLARAIDRKEGDLRRLLKNQDLATVTKATFTAQLDRELETLRAELHTLTGETSIPAAA